MSQFGLGTANSHWGYSSANYSPYLTGSGLSTCGTTSAAQFNNPALGFSCSATEQATTQDFTNNARECLPSKLCIEEDQGVNANLTLSLWERTSSLEIET